jgi:branched-subunit amino acid aminotransferase/4-amino-4-deoxychorismate lyase
MIEPRAFLNGEFTPASQALLPIYDGGFIQGTTVAEQLRTFGGKLFRLGEHVDRLFHSLSIVDVSPGMSRAEFMGVAERLVQYNYPLLAAGDDLGLAMFVTPGAYSAMVDIAPRPTICLHSFPLRFGQWASKYTNGEWLATTDVRQVPKDCWPPELKCRSRMHYYLADQQARRLHPGSRAIMLDHEGCIVEATTANIVLYRYDEGLILPPVEKVLPGISQAELLSIASDLEIRAIHREIRPVDLAGADEAFLTSTSPCMLPVTRFNGEVIGSGHPGPVFAICIAAWSERVGLEIVSQAHAFAAR